MTIAGAQDQINSDQSPSQNFEQVSRMFGSCHAGGCHFAMADGSVRFVGESVNLLIYQQTAIRDDGAPFGWFP